MIENSIKKDRVFIQGNCGEVELPWGLPPPFLESFAGSVLTKQNKKLNK